MAGALDCLLQNDNRILHVVSTTQILRAQTVELITDEAPIRDCLKQFLPSAKGAPILSMRVCLYTNSPDSHFIIDRLAA